MVDGASPVKFSASGFRAEGCWAYRDVTSVVAWA